MTPMIDIVFLLLIFFVCAAAGAVQEKLLATDLAATGGVAAEAPPEPREPWTVELWVKLLHDPDGRLRMDVNGTPYAEPDQLEAQLQALARIDATNPVILDVGPGVTWGEVIDIYDRCRRSGLQSVNFATDPASQPPAR